VAAAETMLQAIQDGLGEPGADSLVERLVDE
jgi:hypothetical protein